MIEIHCQENLVLSVCKTLILATFSLYLMCPASHSYLPVVILVSNDSVAIQLF